jgi:hypothetical protein
VNDNVKVPGFIFIFFENCFHGFGFRQRLVVVILTDVKKAGGRDTFDEVLVEFL